MSTLSKKSAALAAYRAAHNDQSTDWQAVAKMLADCIPATREKKSAEILPRSDGFAPFADYPINKYKADRVGPTCVVTFADGQTVRMSCATLPNKPLNVGRGLRLAVAAWQSRRAKPSQQLRGVVMGMMFNPMMNRDQLQTYCDRRSNSKPAGVTSCHFERSGEIIARFNPAECDRHIAA